MTSDSVIQSIRSQSQLSEWGDKNDKLRGELTSLRLGRTSFLSNLSISPDLAHPALVILIISKTFAWAGRDEFNFAMVETEYQRICKTEMAGRGKHAWSLGVMQLVSVVNPHPVRLAAEC
jgi:origin recognition complex subunit 4